MSFGIVSLTTIIIIAVVIHHKNIRQKKSNMNVETGLSNRTHLHKLRKARQGPSGVRLTTARWNQISLINCSNTLLMQWLRCIPIIPYVYSTALVYIWNLLSKTRKKLTDSHSSLANDLLTPLLYPIIHYLNSHFGHTLDSLDN